MLRDTIDSIVIQRPAPTPEKPQHLCLDKGYDYSDIREFVHSMRYTAHIKARGQEQWDKQHLPRYRARRWVVERTHSWINRFRRLLIRWEKKADRYLDFLRLACAYITFRAAGVFG